MYKPHVTVACVVQAEGRFLVVEERVRGKLTWNQPAGHLEERETLCHAAARELLEETGITANPQYFLALHQWLALDQTLFLRFSFVIDLPAMIEPDPQDSDICGSRWVTADEILRSHKLRSPLVAESIRCYQSGKRYPLDILVNFNIPE
jgi:phosphatase NudJ